MQQLPLYKRILGYLLPVLVRKGASPQNPLLELYYYRGRYQLATLDALYSDGEHYRPLRIGFKHIAADLPNVKSVLVLGTGLGSAVQILSKNGCQPDVTLIDHDETVLKWAIELLPAYKGLITPLCSDAQTYMVGNKTTFDLLVVDIFNSRVVPAFVTSRTFLQQCRNSIHPGGHLVLNYIIHLNEDWLPVDAVIRSIFPKCYCIDDGLNRIVIATV